MMHRISSISARHEQLALREPFQTAKRRASVSDTVFVELRTDKGLAGHGAATPVEYVTGETIESVLKAVAAIESELAGRPVRSFASLAGILGESLSGAPSARAAIEMAIIDAAGKAAGEPSYATLGGIARRIESDLTIPVVPRDRAAEIAADAAARGFRRFKMKASGADPEADIERATAIVAAAPGSTLIVDANQGFTPVDAVKFMRRLTSAGVTVDIFEQPVDAADLDGLAWVTRELDVPVFADESAKTVADVTKLARHRSVSGVNVKLMKSGVFGALEIAGVCVKAGLGLMLGCMIEPRVGIAAAIHVACAVPAFRYFDLDADLLLADEGTGLFTREGAFLSPGEGPGLGMEKVE